MAAVDPRFGNSSGYFKDPVSGEDLSPDTERVVKCEITEDGKFVWPQVLQSDGDRTLKIVYKLFTEEEKELYKQYRGRPAGSGTRRRSPSSQAPKYKTEETPVYTEEPGPEGMTGKRCVVFPDKDEYVSLEKYDPESAVTPQTLALIAECDQCLGISNIGGLRYAMLSKRGSNKVYHIPRSLVPDSEFERICNGGVA